MTEIEAFGDQRSLRITSSDDVLIVKLDGSWYEVLLEDATEITIEILRLALVDVYNDVLVTAAGRDPVATLIVDPGLADEDYDELWFDLQPTGALQVTVSIPSRTVRELVDSRALLEEAVDRYGYTMIALQFHSSELDGAGPRWSVCADPIREGETVGGVARFRSLLKFLVHNRSRLQREARPESLSYDIALASVLAGFPQYLVGQVESDWLEVKSRGYDIANNAGVVELAQDVARFANGDTAGLLVLGARTKRVRGQDVIEKVFPLPLTTGDAVAYHGAIDRRVYPPVRGLKVEAVAYGQGAIIVIALPQQSEEDKPFLLHGAIVGEKFEGGFISIVRRRGEQSIPIGPAAIHAALAIGRRQLANKLVQDQ